MFGGACSCAISGAIDVPQECCECHSTLTGSSGKFVGEVLNLLRPLEMQHDVEEQKGTSFLLTGFLTDMCATLCERLATSGFRFVPESAPVAMTWNSPGTYRISRLHLLCAFP